MYKILIILVSVLFYSVSAYCGNITVKFFQTDQRYSYRIDLLKLALDKTVETDGLYTMAPVQQKMTQARGLDFLSHGRVINVAFLPTTIDREKQFLPVKIPILRGILGYRVFLVHRDSESDFSVIDTFEQLQKNYSAGFGEQWADLEILEKNGIRVIKTPKYESLFAMLENRRFDYFPRGINEAWNEVELFSSRFPHLAVDSYLALYYPYPVYFFVNKNDKQLAKRIERGLNLALQDGSFKALFIEYHKDLIKKTDLDHRKLFRLNNPTLPPDTPEPDTGWWLKKDRP